MRSGGAGSSIRTPCGSVTARAGSSGAAVRSTEGGAGAGAGTVGAAEQPAATRAAAMRRVLRTDRFYTITRIVLK
ncbi:hypothetical protein GCM10010171_25230 [Actinokineospora fastidiosa]|uniref:Uncharacterized protein n=1 Tax=Actinokineospora fastidiosa TaxID=1816 RepID=A0A918GDY5_9PSEU|nr:hypothetical protein GCM10010171_25230 [Actinokineospora fastidiosa]